MSARLSFHGGAGTVTGSRHLVQRNGTRFLVDAGMFQGLKKLRELNWTKPRFEPESLDFLLLTHAHIDHAGYLPRLVKDGFRSPIYCTRATLDLAQLLLMDAAKIQEEDAAYANRKGFSRHKPALPLYTTEDAAGALGFMEPVDYAIYSALPNGTRAVCPGNRKRIRRPSGKASVFGCQKTRQVGRWERTAGFTVIPPGSCSNPGGCGR